MTRGGRRTTTRAERRTSWRGSPARTSAHGPRSSWTTAGSNALREWQSRGRLAAVLRTPRVAFLLIAGLLAASLAPPEAAVRAAARHTSVIRDVMAGRDKMTP